MANDGAMLATRRLFLGRDRELDDLASGFDEAKAGLGNLFVLVGPAGIGKTRLADEAARIALSRGLRPLWGRCWETGGAPAYWPWIQILRELDRPSDGPATVAAAGEAARALRGRPTGGAGAPATGLAPACPVGPGRTRRERPPS